MFCFHLGIQVVSSFGKQNTGFRLRRRKWRRQPNIEISQSLNLKSEKSSSKLQRRITFPRTADGSSPVISSKKDLKTEKRRVSAPK